MRMKHVLLVLLVVLIWGLNFSVIKLGLREIPPILLCALRFLFVAFPAVFFLEKPGSSWKLVILYGLATFAIQFSLLFLGMKFGVSAGIASLILQCHVIFTVQIAYFVLKEPIFTRHIIGGMVAFLGIGVVASNMGGDVSVSGFVLILGAALSLAVGNVASKKINSNQVINLIVWGSLFASVPLLLASYLFENSQWSIEAIKNTSLTATLCIFFLVYPVTFFGFSAWSFLLNK